MASGALFSSQSSSRSPSKNLVEFKAGKMEMKGTLVSPDTRKGLVYIYQSEDELMHFCWMERKNGKVEDELILFPDDAEFLHVKQCTTGRVYLLKFKLSARRMFFWVQEPKDDKDEDNCKKINEFLNNPRSATNHNAAQSSGSSSGKATPGTAASMMNNLPPEILQGLGSDTDLHSLLGNMSQQQLMQLLSGMGGLSGLSSILGQSHEGRPASSTSQESSAPPSRLQPWTPTGSETPASGGRTKTPGAPTKSGATKSVTPATPSSTSGTGTGAPGPLRISDLNKALSSLAGSPASDAKTPSSSHQDIDLSTALTSELMTPLLQNADVRKILMPLLPDYEDTGSGSEELKETLNCSQFKQAMASFSHALTTGQLGPVIAQFGLGDAVTQAATRGDIEAFVTAMQATQTNGEVKKQEEVKSDESAVPVVTTGEVKKQKEEDKDRKQPEDMDVD